MKKIIFSALTAIVCGMAFTSCSQHDDPVPQPVFATLTFEDEDWKAGVNYIGQSSWSSLIDSPQYGGPLLYPADEDATIYQWDDKGNTYLAHEFCNGYMDKAYWGGGMAVSNYLSEGLDGSYTNQLSIFEVSGHNGSKNFCVSNGYASYPGQPVPTLYFSDNKERIIDHMYVVNTTYALTDMFSTTSGFKPLEDWLKIIATGYDAKGAVTGQTEFYLAKDGDFVTEWTKFDLSVLGKVLKVEFNMDGSCVNAWGLSTPAYFAFDDVVVRMN